MQFTEAEWQAITPALPRNRRAPRADQPMVLALALAEATGIADEKCLEIIGSGIDVAALQMRRVRWRRDGTLPAVLEAAAPAIKRLRREHAAELSPSPDGSDYLTHLAELHGWGLTAPRQLTAADVKLQRKLFKQLEVPREDWDAPSGLLIAFAHSLVVPAGKLVNTPLRLRPFQLRFVRDVYNPQHDGRRRVRQAVLSLARRNGKTLTAAVILLAHLAGPFKKPNSTVVSAATSRNQAALVYRLVRDMVRVNGWLRHQLDVAESHKTITQKVDGTVYQTIAAEAGTQFGMGLDLVIYDELAQAKNRELYDTLTTSLGSQAEPLMMIISTQAPTDQHILSELIDYGAQVNAGIIEDPSFVCHCYSAPLTKDLPPESEWKTANPGLGDYRDLDELRSAVERAKKLPAQESAIRNLYFNQRVRTEDAYLSPSVFEKNNGEIDARLFLDGRPVYGGLDLSACTDLTALVLAAEDDAGNIHLLPRAWTPADTVLERTARDRAPYDAWVRHGQLIEVPGPSINYDFVAAELARCTETMNIVRIAFDPWSMKHLRDSLARIGISIPLEPRQQGFKSMSPPTKLFHELALAGQLRHGGHPVMRWCFANAVVVRDAADNIKLDKSKAYGRIDVAVAAVMAVGTMRVGLEETAEVAAMIA